MYKTRKRVFSLILNSVVLVLFIVLSVAFVPTTIDRSFFALTSIPAVIFVMLCSGSDILKQQYERRLYIDVFEHTETQYLMQFIARLRFCYSLEDFYKTIGDIFEDKADCSVMFVDREKNYVLYNSPSSITTSLNVHLTLAMNFPASWKEGVFFFDESFGLISSYKNARGFFFSANKQHLYIFCRYTRLFDFDAYNQLFEEFKRFQVRAKTIGELTEISDLTTQWQQLADAQRSFLQQKLPDIPKLKLTAYYAPLINVSGDYYAALPINQDKTLLLFGDVSGKGLAAALIMGLVVSIVNIMDNKEDIVSMILQIDKAIKNMHLQDKYTVLFLGIVDTRQMTLKYINASMADPVVLSRRPTGYRIKPLIANASLVGIIDMKNLRADEVKLYHGDTIFMASDGLSEILNEEGVQLGDSDIFRKTLENGAEKPPQQFVDDIVRLIPEYNGGAKLHDDITIMIAKVG
ncbi:MAG: serine/threonine-protein phosphatase [Treponema sp.]|nr:serine/threonine-protein phosphatase [Treponema sp.]